MTSAICCRALALSCDWEDAIKDRDALRADHKASTRFIDAWIFEHFHPLGEFWKHPVDGRELTEIRQLYSCDLLGNDGRCTIYEIRPRVCQIYTRCEFPTCTNEDCRAKLPDEAAIERMWRS